MRKTALITGGSKGIGLATAEAFLANDMNVCITARKVQEIQAVASVLEQKYPDQVLGVVADVRNFDQMHNVVKDCLKTWGGIDYVIANAGIGKFAPVDEMSLDDWNDVIDINLSGVFYTAKATIEALKRTKGYFISISSLAGTNFFEQGTAYNASKFGVVGFTQAMMLDLRKYDIKVSTIMPGSVSTYFNGHIPSDLDKWKIQPEDIGQLIIDMINMPERTLPSKIEVRPSKPA